MRKPDPSFDLQLETEPTQRDVECLRDGLKEHSADFADGPGFCPMAVFARDADERIVGGVYGFVNWTWLDVSLLWVSQELRGQGLGSKLMEAFEDAARKAGCENAHLETFSYQAKDFYERHGYRVFATLPDYPPGHTRFYLRKRLVSRG